MSNYCNLPRGLDCTCRSKDGKCEGGRGARDCRHRKPNPSYVPPASTTSKTTCFTCVHEQVCSLKAQYKKVLQDIYPAVLPCGHYENSIFRR